MVIKYKNGILIVIDHASILEVKGYITPVHNILDITVKITV